MICPIYSARYDSKQSVDSVLVIGDNIPEIFEQTPDMPTVQLIVQNETHDGRTLPRVEPIGERRCAFGGSFVYTSDSRFPYRTPVAIFNRKMDNGERNLF